MTQTVKLIRHKYRDAAGQVRECGTFYLQYQLGGKQVKEATHTSDPKVAETLRKKRESQMVVGQVIDRRAERLTFLDMKQMILDDYQVNQRTSLDRVTASVGHLSDFFCTSKAASITADRVRLYIKRRQAQTVANATVNRELAALKRMFRLAQESAPALVRPPIRLLQEASPPSGFFERPQLDAVLRHLPEDLRAPILVGYLTGWRLKSEILNRQWKHVDFAHGWLRLEAGEGKTRQPRQFPLIPELRQVLQGERALTETLQKETDTVIPWVFHRQGRRIKHLRRSWRTACTAAGLPGKIPHDLRRTAVRNLERSGVSRSAAMKLVGHKTESVYRRYAIVSEADLQQAGEQLTRCAGAVVRSLRAARR